MPPKLLREWITDDEVSEFWVMERIFGLDDLDDVVWATLAAQGGKVSPEEARKIRRPYSAERLSDAEAERRAM